MATRGRPIKTAEEIEQSAAERVRAALKAVPKSSLAALRSATGMDVGTLSSALHAMTTRGIVHRHDDLFPPRWSLASK